MKLSLLLKIYIVAAFIGFGMITAAVWPLRSGLAEARKLRWIGKSVTSQSGCSD
jgi:hypothetical protein